MLSKTRKLQTSLVLLAALLLSGCSSKSAGPISKLSGKAAIDGPLVVVKIDDTDQAHPQVGIDKADLIYIEQVEGGLVRLAAIFSTEIPDQIGPVRSARISDIDLLAQYGKVAFFYSGAQRKMLPVIEAANLYNLGAQKESPKLYTRDASRIAPFDMIISGAELRSRISGLDVATMQSAHWKFGDIDEALLEDPSNKKIKSVKVSWPAANYIANWNGKSWDLLHNGKPNVTSDGIQISPATFVIQNVVITNSEFVDKTGAVTPLSVTVGEGSGWILRDGIAIPATWNRPSPTDGTTWSDANGEEIKFASGQIWVALTDKAPEFTEAPTTK
ncbi:MAG: DUF3048 domain-containing protein [Candidatus Nanopelagicaceae bacterium]